MPIARLITAKSVPYVDKVIASGTSKDVYFTEDGLSVVEFYQNPAVHNDPLYRNRLNAIFTQFNLTVPRSEGGAAKNAEEAARMRKLFCWPTGVTVSPKLGFVAPIFPKRFWFYNDPRNLTVKDNDWQKEEKKAAWFTLKRVWKTLAKRERGDFRSSLQICLLLSHALARLHMMGLAHSDLSGNNILIDPIPSTDDSGWPGCLVIDLDTLVVPGFFPPAVIGTKGYIAPEVLSTSREKDKKKRRFPSIATDKHALAVLIYELLLNRHPLDGPKMRSDESEEEDEFLAFGQDALFIEHPTDTSNRPKKLSTPYSRLGRPLASCIEKAFIHGLHDPEARPLASEWESAFWKTFDLLHPCLNTTCLWRWFVCEEGPKSSCPWCGSCAPEQIPVLQFLTSQGLLDRNAGKLICWHGRPLQRWHVEEHVTPLPFEDKNPSAELTFNAVQNKWFIRNLQSDGLKIVFPYQKLISRGAQEPLTNGTTLQLGGLATSRVAKFVFEANASQT
jgi:serine/threonine protein kinase